MKITYHEPSWLIDSGDPDLGTFRVAPSQVHDFVLRRDVLHREATTSLDGTCKHERRVGVVIGGPTIESDPQDFAERVLDAHAKQQVFLAQHPYLLNRAWVLDLSKR